MSYYCDNSGDYSCYLSSPTVDIKEHVSSVRSLRLHVKFSIADILATREPKAFATD